MNNIRKLALAIASAVSVSAVPAVYAAGDETLEEVNVTVSPLEQSADAVAAPVSVLSGDKLRNAASSTLGQTLKSQLGVADASFGGGVGLPVIRGQSANRVKVLNDNLDSADASNTSSDHAATIEPLLAKRIDILRGPATLRYGSGAIGGVVNVTDGRIPSEQPEQLEGAVEMRHDTSNNQNAEVFRLSNGLGEHLAWYVDGVYRENGDTQIPGKALDREALQDSGSNFNTDGHVANTNARAKSGSGGISWISDSGYLGLSVNHLANNYGIPPGAEPGAPADAAPDPVRIDMQQTRYDVKGEHRFDGDYWDKLLFRLGYTDYQHVELEDGNPGTRFTNNTWESRVELTHGGDTWRGAYGLQLSNKDFAALGEEAFVPPSVTQSAGAFVMKERDWDQWHLDLGGRLEHVSVDPNNGDAQDFGLTSASGAVQYFLGDHQHLSLGLASAERAPVQEELFADGVHVAEGRYLLGNRGLSKENSVNLELGYHHHNEDASGWHAAKLSASVYYNHIGDYIYARDTGMNDPESGLGIFNYTNRDAHFYGAEASLEIPLRDALRLTLFGDSVRAAFDDRIPGQSRDVPRLPPLRFGFALGGDYDQWNWNLRTTRATAQDRPGAFDTPTDGYTRVDLTAQYDLPVGDNNATVFVNANNLLDDEIRNSTSLLRNYAPDAGRSIEAGVRFIF
ncbi:TonB-dependent receptor [Microbulbifer sp. SAOS-129_SWC]|uniref:TonB-dependent receptor n=1 Tax=Microbulbifer sp. SAOS-129_SWC TaxID=3145235 RepID=UPI00321747D9